MLSLANKKILIVEDFAEFARSLRGMLHPMGATESKIVNNAQDAIEACNTTKFDIILSDYNLGPKKDGQQLLEELQHQQLIKSSCIFIMITAENTTSMVMAAVEYVPDSYIAKPFNGNLLQARLQKAMEKKQAMLEVNRALRNKQWVEALKIIDTVKSEHPKFKMSCLRAQITALKNLKKLDDALKIAEQIASVRSIPWALESIGEILYLKKDYQKSIAVFSRLVAEFPMSVDGYDWLAKVQCVIGESQAAQKTIEEAIRRSPKVLQRQKVLGAIAEENSDYQTMAQAYRDAIKYGQYSAFSSTEEYLQLTSAISTQIKQATAQQAIQGEPEQPQEDNDSSSKSEEQPELDYNKLKAEVARTFENIDAKFPKSESKQLQTKLANAEFLFATCENDEADVLVEQAKETYINLSQQLDQDTSISVCKTLTQMGENEFADMVINTAAKQYFEDSDFIVRAAKSCNKPELLKLCKQASRLNALGIEYFEKKDFQNAANAFSQVYAMAPGNINMSLNYIQSLLKLSTSSEKRVELLETTRKVLESIPQIVFPDPRFERYKELKRLTLLLLEKSNLNQVAREESPTEPDV
jgi:DNA-binding response OmpR family regulator